MNKFKRFLANLKGSAFIENLMVYITVAVIGLIVVGIIGKTINDAAAGSEYQDEIQLNGSGNSGSSNGMNGMSDEEFYNKYGVWPDTISYTINNGTTDIINDFIIKTDETIEWRMKGMENGVEQEIIMSIKMPQNDNFQFESTQHLLDNMTVIDVKENGVSNPEIKNLLQNSQSKDMAQAFAFTFGYAIEENPCIYNKGGCN